MMAEAERCEVILPPYREGRVGGHPGDRCRRPAGHPDGPGEHCAYRQCPLHEPVEGVE